MLKCANCPGWLGQIGVARSVYRQVHCCAPPVTHCANCPAGTAIDLEAHIRKALPLKLAEILDGAGMVRLQLRRVIIPDMGRSGLPSSAEEAVSDPMRSAQADRGAPDAARSGG